MLRPVEPEELVSKWHKRELEWARELGRVRLGVEPVEDQVVKYRRVTWLLMTVAGGIGTFIIALFCAFRHPGIGLVVGSAIVGPIIVSAWLGQMRLEARAAQYLREKAEVERLRGLG